MEHLKYSFHNIIKTYQQKLYHEPVYLLSIFFQIIFMIYQLVKINLFIMILKEKILDLNLQMIKILLINILTLILMYQV